MAAPATQQAAADGPIIDVVRAFVTAQHDFDLATISTLAAKDYIEISPLGEVDPREKMLGFYAPDKKSAAPPMQLGQMTVTKLDVNAAIVITDISYNLGDEGSARSVSYRAAFVLVHTAGRWKLVSAQYTPIRAKS